MRLAIVLAVAVSAAAAASVTPAATRSSSGVSGRVLYGPTCPVQRVGQSCTRPYQAWITIRHEPDDRVVAHLRSAADGSFRVRLPPGRYLLVPQSGRPFPRGAPLSFSVQRGRYTSVTVRFDSGIR